MRLNDFPRFRLVTLAGVGCFLVLAYTNANPAAIAPHWLQFALFYAGIALLAWGLGAGDYKWNAVSRQEIWLIVGVLGLALILRLWGLGSKVPAPVDELLPMSEILALWDNPHLPMISPFGFISSQTRLFASWQAASVAVFGHNLLALRIPSAIVGTLTVGAVYFLGRVLYDKRTALIGALILATYPPHLHFSRIGIVNIADPLFGTLAFAFLCLAFKSNRRIAWVLGGVALGLTQYFYEGGRLLYPGLIGIWVIVMLISQRKLARGWGRGLLIHGFTACVVASPIYFTLATSNDSLSSRLNTLALTQNDWLTILTSPPNSPTFDWLLRHLTDPFLLFINRPDPTAYYGGSTALILVFLVPVFLVGLVSAIRTWGGRGLLLWFLAAWVGNILMVDSALAARYVVVFPAVALLMAVGIVQIAAFLPKHYGFKVAVIYVSFCLIAQTVYYFGAHLEAYNRQLVPGRNAYDALFRAGELPPDTAVYLIDPPPTITEAYAQIFLRFLADDKTIHVIETPTTVDFSTFPAYSTYAFFIPSDDTAFVGILEQYFDLSAPEYPPNSVAKAASYTLYIGTLKSPVG